MTNKKQGDILRITWLDAFGRGTWCNMADVDEGLVNFIEAEIVGYFAKEDKNFVVLSMGLQYQPTSAPFLHLEFIPKGAITKIVKLNDK